MRPTPVMMPVNIRLFSQGLAGLFGAGVTCSVRNLDRKG